MNWLTRENFTKLWPHAHADLVDGIIRTQADAFKLGQIDTQLRLVHFLAQCSHESGGGTVMEENLNYSAKRLTQVWPKRFPTELVASPYAHNPKALGIKVYGGRLGNAPGPSDAGFRHRGRGLIQLTGHDAYEAVGKICGLDLLSDPDLASAPLTALKVACGSWLMDRGNGPADDDDIEAVTHRINGGFNGLIERTVWLTKWKRELGV